MTLLIAYASKHGSTQGIAERIAEKLRQMGKKAETRSVDTVEDPESYEALVTLRLHSRGHMGQQASSFPHMWHWW